MSLLHIDGFDFLATDVGSNDPSSSGANVLATLLTEGYTGGQSVHASQFTRTGYGGSLSLEPYVYYGKIDRPIPTVGGVVVGFAFYKNASSGLFGGNNYVYPLTLQYDDLVGHVTTQLELILNDVAGLAVINGDGTTICATAPLTIFPNGWNYIELKADAKAGLCQIRVNGQVVATGTGQLYATKKSNGYPSGPYYNLVEVGNATSDFFSNAFIDDLYILSTTDDDGTGLFRDFQGDVVVHGIPVVSDNGPNQMNQFGGSVGHFSSVNGVPDDDNSYLFTSSTGFTESFGIGVLPNDILEVLAVGVVTRARKDSAGVAHYAPLISLGTNTVQGPTQPVTTTYFSRQYLALTKPGGGAWTIADAQAVKIGLVTV